MAAHKHTAVDSYSIFTARHDRAVPRRCNTTFDDFIPPKQLSSMAQEDAKKADKPKIKVKHAAQSLVRVLSQKKDRR